MSILVCLVSSGKGTWGAVSSLIRFGNWDKVIAVCNDFGFKNFSVENFDEKKLFKVEIDEKNPQDSLNSLSEFIKKNVSDLEVAVNLTSGSGMEHMILVSAVLKAGLGLSFVYSDFGKLKVIDIFDKGSVDEEE